MPPEGAASHVMFTILQVTDGLTYIEHMTIFTVRQPDLTLGEIAQVTLV